MRIIMMGTGPFAAPTLRQLSDSDQADVVALVTRPEVASKGRRKMPPNPMRLLGEELGLEIFAPSSINSEDAIHYLQQLDADLLVVCDYGQILSNSALETARLGGINLHGSLLPKYRGAAPVHWAIYRGETKTGVSVIHMTPGLDAGPILMSAEIEIGESEEQPELESRLSEMGKHSVMQAIQTLKKWNGSDAIGAQQDKSLVTKAPRLTRANGLIQWNRKADEIKNQIRAFKPWPGTYTFFPHSSNKATRVVVDQAKVVATTDTNDGTIQTGIENPGTIVHRDKSSLLVSTGEGLLSILRVQPSGKRMMEIDEYLRGNQLNVGQSMLDAET